MNNLKVSLRLALGFGAVLLLLVAIAFIGITRLSALNDSAMSMSGETYPKVVDSYEIEGHVNQIARSMRNLLIYSDDATTKKELDAIEGARGKIKALLEKLEKAISHQKGKELFKDLLAARAQYAVHQEEFVKLVAERKQDEAKALLMSKLRPTQLVYFAKLDALIEFESELMQKAGDDAAEQFERARMLMIGLTGLALLLGGVLAWLVARSITRPLGEAVKVAQAVAGGDLTSRIDSTTRDETGQLMQSLKVMNESLAAVVGQVRSGTDTIATASSQIASGNQDLSQRTEEQASSLEETAASMEQLTGTVKQNAENARQANQLSQSASEVAVKGGEVVGQVVDTMASINQASRKIADIISVIDGIAFQTNILALNAAVEAARAGEQGRGFAVVASEVRSLAQRSASAAKEIKALIDDSVGKVDAGSQLVEQAGRTMQEVVGSIRRVTDIMGEIAAASQEQTSGIEQVNQAITQMDQVTQQNAALVEQAAAAAQSMREQAAHLVTVVGEFRLGDEAMPHGEEAQQAQPAARVARLEPPASRPAQLAEAAA